MKLSKYIVKGTSKRGLVGSTIGFFIGFTAVVVLGSTIKFLKPGLSSTGVSGAFIGLLVASPNLSGSLLRIPFSAWSDAGGARRPMLILLIFSIIGLGGLTFIGFFIYPLGITIIHYPILLILGFLSGCGLATFSVGITQTSYWFPKNKQGSALGTYAGIGNIAPGIFSLLLAFILPYLGLGGSYLVWFIVLILGTMSYHFIGLDAWSFQLEKECKIDPDNQEIDDVDLYCQIEAKKTAKEYGQQLFPSHALLDSLKDSAKLWQTWVLVGLYFTSFGGFIGLASWFPTYWNTLHALGDFNLGLITISISLILNAIFIAIGSITRVYSGPLADKYTGYKITVGGILTILIGALMMMNSNKLLWLAILAMIIIAIGMGIVNAGVFKIIWNVDPKAIGGAAGWIGGLGAFGGFVIPPLMGIFVDQLGLAGYPLGFMVFLILSGISIVLLLILRRSKIK